MSAKSRTGHPSRTEAADLPDLIGEFGQRLLAADNPLDAELSAAVLLAVPRAEGGGRGLGELFVSALIDSAGEHPSPQAAALLRAVAAVSPPHLRRLAVNALGTVTAAGHYPPQWAAQIGRATPQEAWRRYDVFEDTETIVVRYGYGDLPHGVLVQVDRCREPAVMQAMVTPMMDELRSILDSDDDPLIRVAPIGLAEARSRMEAALARDPHEEEYGELSEATVVSLPIARARLRRLPVEDRPAARSYDAEDRAAAVAEFLASPHAADAGDEKIVRFWAEVLAGYSAYIPGDPPGRIGSLKLSQLLRLYVPTSFTLTDDQRRGLPEAVTAWTWWAADRQQLDEPARAELAERLSAVLADFDRAYADPDAAIGRGYLAGLPATTDAAVLSETMSRRTLTMPFPDDRGDDEGLRQLDAADPAHRRTFIEQEYGECDPPEGMEQPDFLAAVVRVCEQLWHDDPPEVWQEARRLLQAGTTNHDTIHQLAGRQPPDHE
jgi:hypothetical protein